MIYGLYLSAAGVVSSSHRQDVIANNLANTETVGFKRSMAVFQQRPAESPPRTSHPTADLARIGGAILVGPSTLDLSQGQVEHTGNPLDLAIIGPGYFAVRDSQDGSLKLTRDGRFLLDRDGYLIRANDRSHRIVDDRQRPIRLTGFAPGELSINDLGEIRVSGVEQRVARVGLFDLDPGVRLNPVGGGLFAIPSDQPPRPAESNVQSGYVERSNVDPATEMVRMLESYRQLEANANLIRLQDQTLQQLFGQVGRIA